MVREERVAITARCDA